MAAHLVQDQHRVVLELIDVSLQTLEQDFVMAFAAAAQHWVFLVAEVFLDNPIAGAFAAGLVVAPGDCQTGVPKHVQQAFLAARLGGVVVAAAHVGEHAGHGYGGFCTAGAHVAEGGNAGLGTEQRRGVAAVAEDAEILRPRAFAYHQHSQRLALVGLPGRGLVGVRADLVQRLPGHGQLFAHIAVGGVQVVAGHHQQAQLVVIAEQRGQALVIGQCHDPEHRDRANGEDQLAEQLAPQRLVPDRQFPQQPAGQHAQHQDEQQELEGQQVADFIDVGFRDIAQHIGVDQYAVLAHEVRDAGAGQEERNEYRLENPAEGQQDQYEVEYRQHHHAEGETHTHAAGIRRDYGKDVLPEGKVVERKQQQAGQQGQAFRTD
ncbi:hypothetical protein FQZ97_753080 [compost metagenome]